MAGGIAVLYLLAGFVATPMAIDYLLKHHISSVLNRNVVAQKVRANPFVFSLRIEELSILEQDSVPLIHLGKLSINVDPLISLFKWGLAVKGVELERPKIRVVRTADGQFNFSDLLVSSEDQSPEKDAAPQEPVRFILNTFKLSGGEIVFEDNAQPLPFTCKVSALNIRLDRLDTHPEAESAIYRVGMRTESGETVDISGKADVEPPAVAATVKLGKVAIAKYAPYYGSHINHAKVNAGTVDLGAKVNWSPKQQTVEDIALIVSQLALTAGSGDPLATVGRFQIAGAAIDLNTRQVRLGRVVTGDGTIDVQLDQDGRLNLMTAFTPAQTSGAATSASDHAESSVPPKWRVIIPVLELRNYTLRFQDRQTDPMADIVLDRITLRAENLSTRKDSRGTVSLAFNWAGQGAVALDGEVGLVPPAAQLAVDAKALDIRPLQPYITPHARLVITGGRLDTQGKFKLLQQENRMDIQYTGVAALNQLKTVDQKRAQDFLNWESLYLKGIEFGSDPFRLTINEVSLTDFYNRLIINEHGGSNLAQILTTDSADTTHADKEAAASGDQTKVAENGGGNFTIHRVTLQGGSIDFKDRLIKPNVELPMSKIAGRISGLDTIKDHKADVLLKGIVGRNIPMEIKGGINPFIEKPYVDLTIGLNGVDLSPFTPYSGKYLGYKLEKGQLSLDLAYKVADNKLTARNKVMLDQLTLGDTVNSPTATKLPVKLALALLKDRQGDIDLDLPLTGDLDDPEFSLGGIVLKMFVNLITKVVSSPFSALGALFGGGEELAFVDYEPGQSRIDEENFGKLDTLAKILFERPALNMEIQGQVSRNEDVGALRRMRLENQLKATKLKSMAARGQRAVPLEQVVLAGPEREKMVHHLYDNAQFAKPRDQNGKLKKLTAAEQEKLLYTAIQISDDDLRLLAHQRALAAKEYLVDQGQVEVSRLFIVEPRIENREPLNSQKNRVKFNLI
jgi:hypothetical protein